VQPRRAVDSSRSLVSFTKAAQSHLKELAHLLGVSCSRVIVATNYVKAGFQAAQRQQTSPPGRLASSPPKPISQQEILVQLEDKDTCKARRPNSATQGKSNSTTSTILDLDDCLGLRITACRVQWSCRSAHIATWSWKWPHDQQRTWVTTRQVLDQRLDIV